MRNEDDLACMSVPDKYKSMGTFFKVRSLTSHVAFVAALTTALRQYYTGEAVAPYPTIFVGGNHEASNHLWEVRDVDSTALSHSVHIAHSPPLCCVPCRSSTPAAGCVQISSF